MAQGSKSRIVIWTIVGILVVAAVVFLIVSRKGTPTSKPINVEAFVKQYERRLERLAKTADEMRADPAMAADLAQVDSIMNLARAGVTEISGMAGDLKAAEAKRAVMTDQWRAIKKLLKQENTPDEKDE